jgi:DNA-binding CsgD family transcriptional regulator
LAREVGDREAEAWALINLSAPDMEFGNYDLAQARLEAGLAAARAVGATDAATLALHNLGCLAWIRRDYQMSRQRGEEALALARSDGWDWLVPSILVNYGLATADLGDLTRAESLLSEGLALGNARGNLWDICTAMEGLARVRAGMGKSRDAVHLFSVAAALRDEIGIPMPHTDRLYFDPLLDGLQQELGTDAYVAVWSAGRAVPWQAAMAELLTASAEPEATGVQADRGRTASLGLTKRELEILHLLAEGESNQAIAAALFISQTTVASHVANIYGKLGVSSRAQAVAFAHRYDLA